jgi:hypothetical protein
MLLLVTLLQYREYVDALDWLVAGGSLDAYVLRWER